MAARYPDDDVHEPEDPSPGLSGMEIINIAESISDATTIHRLGLKLGFEWAQVNRYLMTNRMGGDVTSKGTQSMLDSWSQKTTVADQRSKLRKALVESELTAIAEKHLLQDPGRPSPMTSQEIEQFRKHLIEYYLSEKCKIKTSPLDQDNYVELDNIYINLKLEVTENQPARKTKKPLTYEDIMNLPSKRVMFVGEAGIGKTTLCAKMVHDWATEQHFKNIKLLLFILLFEMKDHKSLGEIVKERLSDSNDVEGRQIDEYARTNPERVLILLDGLDEFNGKAKIIREILESTKLKSCQVIVTTRPFKVEEISTNDRLSKIYTRIQVEGFNEIQVKQYVQKFFLLDPKAGENLLLFMQENGNVVFDTMAHYPIYCTMLCQLWNEERRRDVIKKFRISFRIFDEMVYQLQEHHLSKTIGDKKHLDFREVDACFEVLGQIAFEGLLDRQKIFDKESFKSSDMALAYKIGILSTKTKRLAPRAMRRETGKRFVEELLFPYTLLQEFMASIHLSSCHKTDPDQFKIIVETKMLPYYMEFKNVFYFTTLKLQDAMDEHDPMELMRSNSVYEDFILACNGNDCS